MVVFNPKEQWYRRIPFIQFAAKCRLLEASWSFLCWLKHGSGKNICHRDIKPDNFMVHDEVSSCCGIRKNWSDLALDLFGSFVRGGVSNPLKFHNDLEAYHTNRHLFWKSDRSSCLARMSFHLQLCKGENYEKATEFTNMMIFILEREPLWNFKLLDGSPFFCGLNMTKPPCYCCPNLEIVASLKWRAGFYSVTWRFFFGNLGKNAKKAGFINPFPLLHLLLNPLPSPNNSFFVQTLPWWRASFVKCPRLPVTSRRRARVILPDGWLEDEGWINPR